MMQQQFKSSFFRLSRIPSPIKNSFKTQEMLTINSFHKISHFLIMFPFIDVQVKLLYMEKRSLKKCSIHRYRVVSGI